MDGLEQGERPTDPPQQPAHSRPPVGIRRGRRGSTTATGSCCTWARRTTRSVTSSGDGTSRRRSGCADRAWQTQRMVIDPGARAAMPTKPVKWFGW